MKQKSSNRLNLQILLLLFFMPLFSYAQVEYNLSKAFTWGVHEKKVSKTVVTGFIKTHKTDFFAYYDTSSGLDSKELYKCLHFIDLNGDGKLDVVFSGHNGGEAEEVSIYVANGTTHAKVFNEMQSITAATWDSGRITSMAIVDWGCCDAYLAFTKQYAVQYSKDGSPAFKLLYQTVRVHDGVLPDSPLTIPFSCRIDIDKYNLRTAPAIDDTSSSPWQESDNAPPTGNVIAKLPKAAVVKVLGKKTDHTGREWWYIETDEKCQLYNSGFYDNENKQPSRKLGWISSRFVTKL